MNYCQAIEGKKTLFLILTKQWYDMILSGVKKEEYRAITDYYKARLKKDFDFDVVIFRNGYSGNSRSMVVEVVKQPRVGTGKVEWGAKEGEKYYVTGLGEVIWSSEMEVAA